VRPSTCSKSCQTRKRRSSLESKSGRARTAHELFRLCVALAPGQAAVVAPFVINSRFRPLVSEAEAVMVDLHRRRPSRCRRGMVVIKRAADVSTLQLTSTPPRRLSQSYSSQTPLVVCSRTYWCQAANHIQIFRDPSVRVSTWPPKIEDPEAID
jgi:hypothetical protein